MTESSHETLLEQTTGVSDAKPTFSARRRVISTVLSSFLPGIGQLILHRLRSGLVIFLTFSLIAVCSVAFRLFRHYVALMAVLILLVLLASVAAWDCAFRGNNPAKRRRLLRYAWAPVVLTISVFAPFLIVALLLVAQGVRPFSVPSRSMEPAIRPGEHVMVDMRAYSTRRVEHRDVVILWNARERLFTIKRVIALGDETIEGKEQHIYLNGNLLDEPFVQHEGTGSRPDWLNTFGPLRVPGNSVFVMGDNRDISLDSRSPELGPYSKVDVRGKVLYIYDSDRIGRPVR